MSRFGAFSGGAGGQPGPINLGFCCRSSQRQDRQVETSRIFFKACRDIREPTGGPRSKTVRIHAHDRVRKKRAGAAGELAKVNLDRGPPETGWLVRWWRLGLQQSGGPMSRKALRGDDCFAAFRDGVGTRIFLGNPRETAGLLLGFPDAHCDMA